MSSGSTLILAVLAVAIMCAAVSAASRRQGNAWNYYYFDGHGLQIMKLASLALFTLLAMALPGQAGTISAC